MIVDDLANAHQLTLLIENGILKNSLLADPAGELRNGDTGTGSGRRQGYVPCSSKSDEKHLRLMRVSLD
jgi:predicted Zn-dependent protease